MLTIANPRCLVSGHIVADFTHEGNAYRMCHRCGKIQAAPAADGPDPGSAERRLRRHAIGAVRTTTASAGSGFRA